MKVFKVRIIILMLVGMLIDLQLFAQTNPPGAPGDVSDVIPLDGGLSLLLAAGVALGVKKAHQYSKRK